MRRRSGFSSYVRTHLKRSNGVCAQRKEGRKEGLQWSLRPTVRSAPAWTSILESNLKVFGIQHIADLALVPKDPIWLNSDFE